MAERSGPRWPRADEAQLLLVGVARDDVRPDQRDKTVEDEEGNAEL
jgi:hypothetical protein